MRILTISHLFPTGKNRMGGIFIYREAEHLTRYGIECDFLVPRPWAPWPLYLFARWGKYSPANLPVGSNKFEVRAARYLRPPGLWFLKFQGRAIAMALKPKARQWHRENPFDVVLGVSMFPDAEAAITIGDELDLPVASLAVGSDVMIYPSRLPVLWSRLGSILEKVDLAVGVSESVCKKIAETGKCKQKPLCVYLGRDNERFSLPEDKSKVRQSLGWAEDDIVAVYVGAVIDAKGINELVRAGGELLEKYPNFRLVCVGGGLAMERLVQLGASVGREGAVVLPGRIWPQEVPMYLQGADFMVFPSYSEGMPQSVLEAMDCGLPVVATRVGGIPEAVIDGETGILIDAENTGQLRGAMEKMIHDKEFRITAGHKGHLLAKKKFDAKSNAKKFAKALRSLVL